MNRKAVVFRAIGDPELALAVIDGMMVAVQQPMVPRPVTTMQPLTEEQMALVKAELAATREKLKEAEAALGVKKPREDREFSDKIEKTRLDLQPKREHKILDMLLGIYALVWLLISNFYDRQVRIWKGAA